MALEDFFTLTETNNGLADPERLKELVGLMHKGSDCVINNISDATRQWSAVASSIALTENKECLVLFVQLDGLIFMNKWLKDASEFVNKTRNNSVEETIIHLLRALTRIDADCDKLVSSGIWTTVKDLIDCDKPNVSDMAKSLLEMWNAEKLRESNMKVEDTGMPDNAERGVSEQVVQSGNLRLSNGDIDASQGNLTSKIQQEKAMGGILFTASESSKDNEAKKTTSDGVISDEHIPYSTNTESFQEPGNETLNKLEPPISCSEETPSAEACSVVVPEQGTHKEEINGSELDSIKTGKLTQKICSSPQICYKEQDPKGTFRTNDTETLNSETEPSSVKDKNDNNAEEKDLVVEVSDCLKTAPSEAGKKMNDKSSGYDRNIMLFKMEGGGERNSNGLEVSKSSELQPKHFKGSRGLFQRTGNLEVVEGRIHDKVEGCFAKEFDFSKKKKHRKDYHTEKKSDFDLEYGIADPLELARLVAIEVEREVEDCRELICSASDQEVSSNMQRQGSSHSITGERCQSESSTAEVSTQRDLSVDSSTREHHITSAQSLDLGSQEARSPQLTEAAEVVEASTDEGVCHFDLNQGLCLEDVEHQGKHMSHPVSIVSASRAVAAPLMHVSPLQFEGVLGWKGSAATSAFRPASPHGVPESDFILSAGGSNTSSRENHFLFNINLNVAESRDDNQIPASFQLASLESSADVSSKGSEKVEFDLNQISDGGAPLDLQLEQDLFHQRSGHYNQFYSSSSSKQPSLRNIDLNDQPIVANDLPSSSFYLKQSQCLTASGSVKSEDSVITIMGRRVEVNQINGSGKKIPVSNGRISEPTMGFNFDRPGGLLAMGSSASYPHPHMLSLSGLPYGSSIPFSSPIYGSGGAIPYMVDSRGAPIVPQIMPLSASSTISTAFPQPPYLFSMPGMPSGNGVTVFRDNFDLNLSMYTEGRDRDNGGFRQLFHPPQPMHFNEHLTSTSSSVGVGGKRKEPEGGWESYPLKQHPQPWR